MRVATLLAALAVMVGLIAGLGAFTFGYAEGWSYFSSDPRACLNCHIMTPQFSSWVKSSHHTVAGCVDCHLPHAFVPKWIAKAENGFNHSWAFTFQDFPEPIQMTAKNGHILVDNCFACHGELLHPLMMQGTRDPSTCVRCHADVGHGPRAALGREPAEED